jgi:predicted RNase H-like nuclease (RuvC/YqgF family)
LNANDAAATAKHTGLTAAKILFAQTAKGQDVLTDDDKALVERLRWSASGKVGAEQARLERNAADRIEAQAAEIERLLDYDEAKANALHNTLNQLANAEQEIERLREALVTVRARIEDIENPFEDGTRQEHIAFEKAVDAASLIASAALGETE